jgi:hypothetical protein
MTTHFISKEMLHGVKKERIILHTMKRRKANLIGHILCLLKHVTEGKIDGMISEGKKRRRRKQLLDDLKKTRGHCELKKEALDCTVCRTRSVRGCGLVVRQTVE